MISQGKSARSGQIQFAFLLLFFFKIRSNYYSLFKYCFAVCSRETYNALTTWLSDARMLASQNIVIILCGNKKDLDADREVTFLEASRFAQENGTNWNRIFWYFLEVVLIILYVWSLQDNITILWLHVGTTALERVLLLLTFWFGIKIFCLMLCCIWMEEIFFFIEMCVTMW